MAPITRERAISVTVAAAAVVVAAFMPWGTIRATPAISIGGPFSNPFEGMAVTMTLTGWDGTLTLAGMAVPNWVVVALALATAGVVWLRATETWHPPRGLPLGLALLGCAHVAGILAVLAFSGKGTIGIGAVIAAIAFVAMSVVCRQFRADPAS
jgi:FtsH-binding integral membrane protein